MIWKLVDARRFIARSRLALLPTWFLFFLFLVLAHPSTGQVPAYSFTKTDTIRAIQRLFDYKRTGGRIYTAIGVPAAIGGAAAGFVGSALMVAITLGKNKNSILPITLLGGAIGLTPTGVGIGRLIRYSRRREDVLIDAYESGVPLPGFVRRKLRDRYFEFTAGAASSPPVSGR
ncbi:hypothetical protein [Spirosoma pomorum]